LETLFAAGTLAWALPLFALSGGYGRYRELVAVQSRADLPLGSPLFGGGPAMVGINAVHLVRWLLSQTQLLALVVVAGALWGRPAPAARPPGPGGTGTFLAVWIAPVLIFQLFVFLIRAGQTMVLYPASLLAVTWALHRLSFRWEGGRTWRLGALVAAGLAADATVILGARPVPVDPATFVRRMDAAGLRKGVAVAWNALSGADYGREELLRLDLAVAGRLSVLRDHPPASTVLAPEYSPRGETGSWLRHLQYYAPDHTILNLPRGGGGAILDTGAPPRDLLFFSDDFGARPERPAAAVKVGEGVWLLPAAALPVRYGDYRIGGSPAARPAQTPRSP